MSYGLILSTVYKHQCNEYDLEKFYISAAKHAETGAIQMRSYCRRYTRLRSMHLTATNCTKTDTEFTCACVCVCACVCLALTIVGMGLLSIPMSMWYTLLLLTMSTHAQSACALHVSTGDHSWAILCMHDSCCYCRCGFGAVLVRFWYAQGVLDSAVPPESCATKTIPWLPTLPKPYPPDQISTKTLPSPSQAVARAGGYSGNPGRPRGPNQNSTKT